MDTSSQRKLFQKLHPVAGGLAFLIILSFWIATVAVEFFGSAAAIAAIKQAIAWGLILLVPSIALTGFSGFKLAGQSAAPNVMAKKRRMPFIAANGALILVPAAVALAILSAHGDFGGWFIVTQIAELIAGAVNLTLIALNMRDGLRMTRARRAAASR
jgi:hypothetical protein